MRDIISESTCLNFFPKHHKGPRKMKYVKLTSSGSGVAVLSMITNNAISINGAGYGVLKI